MSISDFCIFCNKIIPTVLEPKQPLKIFYAALVSFTRGSVEVKKKFVAPLGRGEY